MPLSTPLTGRHCARCRHAVSRKSVVACHSDTCHWPNPPCLLPSCSKPCQIRERAPDRASFPHRRGGVPHLPSNSPSVPNVSLAARCSSVSYAYRTGCTPASNTIRRSRNVGPSTTSGRPIRSIRKCRTSARLGSQATRYQSGGKISMA